MADHFVRRWIVWVSAGESVGFLAPALAFVISVQFTLPALPLLVIGGATEGAVLGTAQATVLRGVLPALRSGRWIGGTAIAAALAWLIGQWLAETSPALSESSLPLLVVLAGLGAPVLLASIGFAQWIELRHHVERAGRWILGSAVAWLVGLAVFFAVASPLWRTGQSMALVVAIGVLA
jgi:hypothetical protein